MHTIVTLLASLALAHAGELHQAARVCDQERMRQLLSRHPSLNETDENGMTPLHIAIDSRKRACAWLLLDAGADREARDRQGRTPFDVAEKIADPLERSATIYMLRNFGRNVPREPVGDGADAGEGIAHEGDQRAIATTD